MKILIDIGNTRLKWAAFEHGGLSNGGVLLRQAARDPRAWDDAFARLPAPETILASNVAGRGAADDLVAACARLWSIVPVFARVEPQRLGVSNGYADFSQLGVDRWMSLLAAWAGHHRPACIVNCGTATTIDGLNGHGQHVGGLIVPGMDLMMQSLNENTDGISVGGAEGAIQDFGRSTGQCVRNGAAMAQAALIDRAAARLSISLGTDLRCIITGGAAERILPGLQRPFEHDPQLVLRGLALLAGEGG